MSLFARLVGTDNKLSIHMLHSLIDEVAQGTRLTGAEAATVMELTAAETVEVINLLGIMNDKTDKGRAYRRLFNYLCLGELGVTAPHNYTDEAAFWAALSSF